MPPWHSYVELLLFPIIYGAFYLRVMAVQHAAAELLSRIGVKADSASPPEDTHDPEVPPTQNQESVG